MSFQSLRQVVLHILQDNMTSSRITDLIESKQHQLKSVIDAITINTNETNNQRNNVSLKCNYPNCNYEASYESVLVAHARVHTGEKPFKCDHPGCGFHAARKDSLVRHHLTHTQGLVCECGYNTKSRSRFRKHVDAMHRTNSAFQCQVDSCRRVFDTHYDLMRHSSVHLKKDLPCNWLGCGKMFRKERDLRAHIMRVHSDEHPLACEWPTCHFRTKFPNSLISHMAEHTGELPFKCKSVGCGLAFKSMTALRAHKLTHRMNEQQQNNPNMNINCNQIANTNMNNSFSTVLCRCDWPSCGTSFTSTSALQLHYNKMHKNQQHERALSTTSDFVCEYQSCGRRFFNQRDLESHQQWHIGMKKYKCMKCAAKYVDVRDMKKHAIRCASDYLNIKLNKVFSP